MIGHDVQREALSQIPSILGCLQHVNDRACRTRRSELEMSSTTRT
jgi:hypothetical protein